MLVEQGKRADAARAFGKVRRINRELIDTGALRWCLGGVALAGAWPATSKEIAARLFVSMRTVDNHVQRICSKLGVNGRDQLQLALAAND